MAKSTGLSQARRIHFVVLGLVTLLAMAVPQMAFAITITDTAKGSTTPPTATFPATVTNGDFLIQANSPANAQQQIIGNGIDETTTWTFDLRTDPDLAGLGRLPGAFPTVGPLTSAVLTLTLTPKNVLITTDTVRIEGLSAITAEQAQTLPINVTNTIQIDLLKFFSADDILGILTANAGQIRMLYQDDAIVSFARLELTDSTVPARCSEEEVQITSDDFIVLPNVSVVIPQPITANEQCKITFSTEAATSEPDPQLLGLGYAFFFDPKDLPDPIICTSLDGPVLTQVASGLDETHTFVSIVPNTPSPHGPLVVAPCIRSEFGGQFRLRRHCLVVECLTR
jgi:hypothetical protein